MTTFLAIIIMLSLNWGTDGYYGNLHPLSLKMAHMIHCCLTGYLTRMPGYLPLFPPVCFYCLYYWHIYVNTCLMSSACSSLQTHPLTTSCFFFSSHSYYYLHYIVFHVSPVLIYFNQLDLGAWMKTASGYSRSLGSQCQICCKGWLMY